jgi:hypothetical protein
MVHSGATQTQYRVPGTEPSPADLDRHVESIFSVLPAAWASVLMTSGSE